MADTTPGAPMTSASQVVSRINAITQVLTAAGVALPVVVTAITGFVGIIRALRPNADPALDKALSDVIAELESALASNDARGRAAIAALKAEIAAKS